MAFLLLHDPSGRLVGVRFAGAVPCTVGRGSENALVVDDPYVDHRHAEIVRRDDGALVVRDLGSVNGLRRPDAGAATGELLLTETAPIQLGRSVLRLAADAPIRATPLPMDDGDAGPTPSAAAAPLRPGGAPGVGIAPVPPVAAPRDVIAPPTGATVTLPRWLAAARQRRVQLALPLALALAAGAVDARHTNALKPLLDGSYFVVGVLGLLVLWAAGWALGTRFRIGEGRFGTHLAVGAMVSSVLVVLEWLAGWADYLQPQGWATLALGGAAVGAAWWLALHMHLRVIRPEWGGRLPALTAGLALMFSACTVGLPALADDFDTAADFTATLKATPPSLVPVTEASRYTADLEALRRRLDEDTDTLDTLGELVAPVNADSNSTDATTAAPAPSGGAAAR